ncbi:hypothetical protein DERP_007850 [Dermatophagoides pteronyssinus]|uniref:Uncharacterized protein n=1 Tax=Dermatophagoides pteronyssinus TaxID=6956 RepID=A0ABQ8IST5_DERPT|nr:hypothetical protein DERP_007850 [Dermatophagoides pteronyssinus]
MNIIIIDLRNRSNPFLSLCNNFKRLCQNIICRSFSLINAELRLPVIDVVVVVVVDDDNGNGCNIDN